ncbi:MAG: hypothetical protein LBJ02_05275, partial [Bifidobacteriaceae bacterium]|nr:hypothetical protein [Bifidobacteriaceae bacterium]
MPGREMQLMQSANYLARTGPDQLALSASFPGVELIGVVLLIVSVIGLIVLVAMLNGVKSVHSAVKELAAQLGQGIPSEALAQARPTGQPEPPTGAGPPAGPVPAAYPSLDLPVEQSPFAAQAGEARPGPQPPSVSAFDGLATPALAAGQGLPGEAPVSEPPTMSQPLISLPGSEPVSQAAAPVADDSLPKALNTAARREISLVGRALKILDELEQSETDPDKLFSLFALDNLMARMRRGSETQMILVGREPERSVREPLSASDVIRTALSQIEHYERIRISLDWDPMIRAYAVVPAAHMIAELLENATRFSPEGTAVEVGSSNHSGDVVLTISDAGVGMSAQELAAANRMMQAGGNPDDLSHGRLGVAVVARLATRLGASVSFAPGQSSDGTGTTAIVRIPSSLIDDRPVAGAPMDQLGAQAVLPPQPKLEDAAMESSVNSFEPVRLDPPTTDTGLPRRSSRGQGGMPSSPFGPPPSAPPSASPPDASRADSIVP